MASDFFTEHLRTVDEKICQAPWLGGKDGKYFRCCFCGYKFKVGDQFRVVYSNNVKGAGGNPIVCEACNKPTPELISQWKERHAEVASGRFWWFFRGEFDHP